MENLRPIPFRLMAIEQMQSLVEHRSSFNLNHCELNVFETRQQAHDFRLSFSGFAVTSMLRGKKVMHLEGFHDFEYVPGETVIAPRGSEMVIDFPEAQLDLPTQCTALVIDDSYLETQLNRIREHKQMVVPDRDWHLDLNDVFLQNNAELTAVNNRLVRTLSSDDPFKDYSADLILQELVLSILRLQYQKRIRTVGSALAAEDPFGAVVQYIRQHLTDPITVEDLCKVACMSKSRFYRQFTEYAGMTPVQLILEERLDLAKQLLAEPELSVKEIAYATGFNAPNYFCRTFKKVEGQTPGAFRQAVLFSERKIRPCKGLPVG